MDPRLDESVRRARTGDPRAFRTVADILGPDLIRFLTLYLGGDHHAAHDVAQEVFLSAWDSLEDIRDGRHLRRWCYRVARCKAVDWIRQRRPRGRRVESLDVLGHEDRRRGDLYSVDALPPHQDGMRRALRAAMRQLPTNYAGAVHLYYLQGCSTQETADLLGLNCGAVKMRLLRARALLRDAIDDANARAVPPPHRQRRSHP